MFTLNPTIYIITVINAKTTSEAQIENAYRFKSLLLRNAFKRLPPPARPAHADTLLTLPCAGAARHNCPDDDDASVPPGGRRRNCPQ